MPIQPTNRPLIPDPSDYSAIDKDTALALIHAEIQKVFPDWTDVNRAAPGNIILHAEAALHGILMRYQNHQARQAFFSTVTRRVWMLAHARAHGIAVKGISAATVTLKFTLDAAAGADVVIPKNTKISTVGLDEALDFFTIDELRIAAGNTEGEVSAIHAELREHTIVSDGSPNQLRPLKFRPYVDGSLAVSQGTTDFAPVLNFAQSGPSDPHYLIFADESDRGFIIFANGIAGQVPVAGDVDVSYRTGGGIAGNVGIGTITRLSRTFTDLNGVSVNLTVTNEAAATGGADRETVPQAKRRIPGATRVNSRTVAKEDFEIVALSVPGVARAMFLTTDEDPAVADNTGEIIVIPSGGGVPSATLKAQVVTYCTIVYPTMNTFQVTAVDPTFKTVNVTVTVKRDSAYTEPQVTDNIEAALTALFALEVEDDNGDLVPNPLMDFGATLQDSVLAYSDIFNAIRDAEGVDRLEPGTLVPSGNVTLDYRDFPQLGNVTVNFA